MDWHLTRIDSSAHIKHYTYIASLRKELACQSGSVQKKRVRYASFDKSA